MDNIYDNVCNVLAALNCVVAILAVGKVGYNFVFDNQHGCFVPKAADIGDDAPVSLLIFLDILFIFLYFSVAMLAATEWPVSLPLIIVVGGLFIARTMVRNSKRLDKLDGDDE